MIAEDIEEEKKEIIRRYRRLLRHAKPVLKEGDAKLVRKAFNRSLQAHDGMRRKSGEPYIYHPVEVAMICIDEIGLGTTSIVSALLHDVVEDTDTTLSDIEYQFGAKVARIIDGLTKISGVFEQGSSQQAENFRKMLLTLSDDVRVILIKLADRLHNMRTLESMSRDKQLKIASETSYIYAPLAHRLGLYVIKSELEDLCLKYTDTKVYGEIKKNINATKATRSKFIRNFIRPIKESLDSLGIAYEIKGRPKSIHSIWDKMRKQNVSFEEVFDLFAVRITIHAPLDKEKALCWQVYSIVTDFYQPNPDRLRDWVSIPKANGYESLHTTVMSEIGQWVEVQIRTSRMDEIAEKGYAAHWKYKENKSREDAGLEMWISKVREILETNDASAIEFVDDFRSNLYSDEVFVFTPKGDLITLPIGATALDFAFDIHTEVGARCIGAKVNQKLVPLNYKLKNGDQVEILTSKKQKPVEDWLKIVVSSKARSRIKDALKEDMKKYSLAGKEIVQRKLKQMKLPLDQENLDLLAAYFNAKTPTDLFYLIGIGKIDHTEIKQFQEIRKDPKRKLHSKSNGTDSGPSKKKETSVGDDLLLLGDDMDVIDYKFARCCNPIPGDDVFGFVTVNEGIKIHRTNCPNAAELLSNYGYRVVKAKWTSRQAVAFLAGLKIIGTDRIGIINDVSNIISAQHKVNMRSLVINTDNGIFDGQIELFVDDTKHLEALITNLGKVSGIETVSRYD
ncbi:MAG: guanosine-3',5'-bis(diphosphate) 3'-pyrophosphohydrolase [Cyclobacteriaceae bacterium]|jgi:guanosine-3',5'-bis(diphosphate) 3'-pyrophosphohydrolase